MSARGLGERGERLGERGRVRLAGPAQGAGQRVQAGLVQDRRGLVTGPPGGPAAQLPGHLRAGGGQFLLRVPAGLVAVVEGLPGLAQFGLGELAGLLGLLHRGEPAADLGDVVAPGGDPGLGRHGQVGAGVRGLAVAEQARAGRRLGQRLQVPAEGAAQLVAVAGHGVGLLLQAVDVGPGRGQPLLIQAQPGLVRLQLAAAQREFLVILVGVPVFQRREPGLEGIDADPGRLPGFLRPLFLPSGRGGFVDRGDDRCDVPGGGGDPGADLVGLVPGVGAEVGGVLGQEGADRRVGGGQVVVLLLDGGQVLEVPRGLLDEVFVDRAEAGRQGAGHLDRVEVLGQQRPAQRDQQVQQLGVAFPAQAEQPVSTASW